MDNSRLNINIYEHIIDEGPDQDGFNSLSSYWYTTALVCSAWRRRSHYNLYRTVYLCTRSQAELLVRTFRTNAPLADLVTSLTIGSFMSNLQRHDTLTWLPQVLWEVKKCSAFNFMNIDWTRGPALYASLVLREVQRCGRSTITTLQIELSQTIFRQSLLLIRALPSLKKLALHCPTRLYTTSDTFPIDPEQGACNQLQNLHLWFDSSAEVSFPLMSFGANVEELSIHMLDGGLSDETLQFIRAFSRLHALHVGCHIDLPKNYDARIKCLLSILNIVCSCALRSLEIRLPYTTRFKLMLHRLRRTSHFEILDTTSHMDPVGLLNSLCSTEMVEVLDRFSALRNLGFMLPDMTLQHDRQWWEAELATRLPSRLHSAITVSIWVDPEAKHVLYPPSARAS